MDYKYRVQYFGSTGVHQSILYYFAVLRPWGIRCLLAANLPYLAWSIALNSFVLSVYEVNVSHALILYHCPYDKIQPDYPAHFFKK